MRAVSVQCGVCLVLAARQVLGGIFTYYSVAVRLFVAFYDSVSVYNINTEPMRTERMNLNGESGSIS